jgi:hypothetical protein
MRRFIRKYFLLIFVFFLILIGLLIGLFYRNNISYNNPDAIAKSQNAALVEKIGILVFLPKDETPTLATVSDPELLKNQPFFADAKKGDKVLIYTNAKKAILYDPVANKIVNMAAINMGDMNKSAQIFPSNSVKVPDTGTGNQF